MEVRPLISVIVPIHNVKEFLKKCIESIIKQSYTNLEIILVDDGSTDGSEKICDEYAVKDSRIKVIHKSNGGLVSARKAGIQVATGDYAAYVDGDDWLEEEAYEKLLDLVGTNLPDIIGYGMVEEYADKTVVCKNKIKSGYYNAEKMKQDIYSCMLCSGEFYEFGVLPNIWAKLVKREILLYCQGNVSEQVTIGEDAACSMAVFLKAKSCIVSEQTPYHYRKHMNSMMSSSVTKREIESLFQSLQKTFCRAENTQLFSQLYKYMFFVLLLKRYEEFLKSPLKELAFGDLQDKRIALYGAGGFGREVYCKMRKMLCGKIELWVDKSYQAYRKEGLPISCVEELMVKEYDVILIAILNTKMCEKIKQDLIKMGIPHNKIKYVIYSENCEAAMKKMLQEIGERRL